MNYQLGKQGWAQRYTNQKEIEELNSARLSRVLTYLKKDYVNLKVRRSFLESWKMGTAEADGVLVPSLAPLSVRVSGDGCSRHISSNLLHFQVIHSVRGPPRLYRQACP